MYWPEWATAAALEDNRLVDAVEPCWEEARLVLLMLAAFRVPLLDIWVVLAFLVPRAILVLAP